MIVWHWFVGFWRRKSKASVVEREKQTGRCSGSRRFRVFAAGRAEEFVFIGALGSRVGNVARAGLIVAVLFVEAAVHERSVKVNEVCVRTGRVFRRTSAIRWIRMFWLSPF